MAFNIKQIGPYEIRGVLGEGGMATVYRGYQPTLGREVAIKVLSTQYTEDRTFLERFKREALAISRLRHPNIVTIYDTGWDGNTPYIVTELIKGKSLREYIGTPLDLEFAAQIITQVSAALDYAHEQGLIHRDVKPGNILIGENNRAVLSDFGIVKLTEGGSKLTATGFGVGTPEYMSPEQGTGDRLDGRSDQYSLGVVLYEMLTAVTPFHNDTPLAVLMGHVSKPLPDARRYNSQLPANVAEVLNRVLSKDRNARYRNCADFAQAFASAVETIDIAAAPTQLDMRTMPATAPVAPDMAYFYAMDQEKNGKYQAAFETLVDLQKYNPNFADVPSRLAKYEKMSYRYIGQLSFYNTSVHTTPAPLPLPTQPAAPVYYNPPNVPTQPQPFPNYPASPSGSYPAAAKNRNGLIALATGGGVLIVAGIIFIVVMIVNGNKPNPTPVTTSAVSTTAVTTAAATTASTTTASVTTASTGGVTTGPATTTADTGPKDPLASQVNDLTAKLYNGQADFKTTADKLRALIKQNPNSWLANRELGQLLYLWNREAGEVDALQAAIKINEKDARSHAYLSMAFRDGYSYERALAEATRAIELDPNDGDARAAYSIALGSTGGSAERSLTEANKALELSPDGLWPRWAVFLAMMTNDDDTALTHIDFLIKRYPSMATFYNGKGGYYREKDDYENARKWYNQAIAIDPQYPYAHDGLGWINYDEAKYDDAYNEFLATTKANDSYDGGHIGLGYTLSAKNRYDDAIDQFRRAIQINIRASEAYNGLSFTYIYKADDSKDAELRTQLYNLSIENADNALKYSPNYTDASYNKGRALYSLKRYKEAESFLKTAVTKRPTSTVYRITLAYNYYALGNYNDARTQAQEILKNDPKYQKALQLLDDIKKITGS